MAKISYLFIFGRTPALAFAELKTFIPDITPVVSDVVLAELDASADIHALMDMLGGTTKIAATAERTGDITADRIVPHITQEARMVDFGISYYGTGHQPKNLAAEVKSELEGRGIRSRYVTAQHGDTLSTVVVDKKHVQEIVIVQNGGEYIIGKTVATQRYESWNDRDYGRPYSDAKSGMLPPKVARMIVNIAGKPSVLLDPFCGMGTVLAEGYMRGWKVNGSDSVADAVHKAEKNISWLTAKYPDTGGSVGTLTVSDAVHTSDKFAPQSINAIVTEPYMGSTSIAQAETVDIGKIKNIMKGLEKLYIGCLREWQKILVSKGRIVMALPAYAIQGRVYTVKKVVDMCENLGYTIVDGPIEYSRPQAIVKREFYIFEKKS